MGINLHLNMESSARYMTLYVAFLRALYNTHQNNHWETKGPNYYSDHILFQRLYEAVAPLVDQAAEKTVGIFGELEKHDDWISKITEKFNADNYNGDRIKSSLEISTVFLVLSEKIYKHLKESDKITLGLDDMIMATAGAIEVHTYLLKQREKA